MKKPIREVRDGEKGGVVTVEHEHYGDVRDVLVRLPHGDPYGGCSYCRDDLFTVRHRLIRELDPAPRSVFEFGALYGYFLVTALDAAPSIDAVGWVDNESHTPGSNAMCGENVYATAPVTMWCGTDRDAIAYGHYAKATLDLGGEDALTDPVFGLLDQYDLIAVDSDHSTEGCLADLRAAHQLNPLTIMVDDWTAGSHGDDIHAAVQMFLEETADYTLVQPATGDQVRHHIYELNEYVTVNGLAVLTRKDWVA